MKHKYIILILVVIILVLVASHPLTDAVIQGQVGIDFPWEDVFPTWGADVMYFIVNLIKQVG